MNISWRWLRDLVPGLDATPQEVADRLAMLGAPVDEVLDLGGPLADIVVARVEQAGPHPNADRLSLCTVNAGDGAALQVVCGAPNVKPGAYYPFAPVGASLPGGMKIRKAKIRGEESRGMLCSARELGLGRDHTGILELHGEFDPGTSFVDALGLDDVRLVVDITPNRPDLLSHVGIAREVAAAASLAATLPDLPDTRPLPELTLAGAGESAAEGDDVRVVLEDTALCPRYFGLVIRGVRVGPSPGWLAARLRAIGLRPISNIVDATNYVLHELGQPLHAFDLDRLEGGVTVRRARAGERITTLDDVERELTGEMLVIADDRRPLAVAGVMGGADSEVGEDTRNILLECALFDPASVRATRTALGLSTDASYRFERGVAPSGMVPALRRAAGLIAAIAGGEVQPRVAAPGPGLADPAPVRLRPGRVEQVLGVRFSREQLAGFLEPLGFTVAADADAAASNGAPEYEGAALRVEVPGHRRYDVAREEDLIEEVARRHGYDAFPEELRPFRPGTVPTHPLFRLEDRLRDLLVGRGLLEAHTAAFAPASDGDVPLLLPLAATESHLRRALLPPLCRRVEYNFARGARSVRVFELGTAFAADGADGMPVESTRLAIACTGLRRPAHWSEPESVFDVWDLKALALEVAGVLGLAVDDVAGEAAGAPGGGTFAGDTLDPGLSFRLVDAHNGAVRGVAGRVRAERIDAPAWADALWGLEVVLETAAAASEPVRFRALPQHPAIERDLALLVPHDRPAAAVAATIQDAGGALLEASEPFDVYAGEGVPAGTRSIAWRLRFRDPGRTLTDAEVDDVVRRVLQRLNDELGITQRA